MTARLTGGTRLKARLYGMIGPVALTLYLVRHAPTINHHQRRYPLAGEEVALSPAGEALAKHLKQAALIPAGALAFVAPSLQARQTAALAGYPQATPSTALLEAHCGVMGGHTWTQLEQTYANLPWHWTRALSDPTLDFGPPGGETGRSFHIRVQTWLLSLLDAAEDRKDEVVAFTHAGVLHAALRLCVNVKAVETPPGTLVTLKYEEGEWRLGGMVTPSAYGQEPAAT